MWLKCQLVVHKESCVSFCRHNQEVSLHTYIYTDLLCPRPSHHAPHRSIMTIPWQELGGKCELSCPQTGYGATIDFHCKPFYGGKKHRVTAEILWVLCTVYTMPLLRPMPEAVTHSYSIDVTCFGFGEHVCTGKERVGGDGLASLYNDMLCQFSVSTAEYINSLF